MPVYEQIAGVSSKGQRNTYGSWQDEHAEHGGGYALKSELDRVAMEGKNLTSSFICNGISDRTTPICLCLPTSKNLKQTSEL